MPSSVARSCASRTSMSSAYAGEMARTASHAATTATACIAFTSRLLLDQRVIEAIVLGIGQALRARAVRQRKLPCRVFAGDKGCHNRFVRLGKYRARGIEQFTTRCQHPPKRSKEIALLIGKSRHVVGSTQPFDVGTAASDARSRAGNVGKDAVERLTIPPLLWLQRVGMKRLSTQSQTIERRNDARDSRRIDVERGHRHIRELQHVRRLATWRCAGVEYALARSQIETMRRALRADVLH